MSTQGNSFGRNSKECGGSKNVWHEVVSTYPVGGKIINLSDFKGKVIPAGSMCQFDSVKGEIKIILAKDVKTASQSSASVEPNTIKGLLHYDVSVDADMIEPYATGNVVYEGVIYADRLAETIPAEVFAVLPNIIPFHEKTA